MNKYQVFEMKQDLYNRITWICDLCGKTTSEAQWFLIQPQIKYEQKGSAVRDHACCSEECTNMFILQNI